MKRIQLEAKDLGSFFKVNEARKRENNLRAVAYARQDDKIFNRFKISISSSKLNWFPWIFVTPTNQYRALQMGT